jgi:tetratricopeptide (TPR) repeat protein
MRWVAVLASFGVLATGGGKAARDSKGHSGSALPQSAGDYMQLHDFAMEAESFDVAEKIAREGQTKFPYAAGFHELIGDSLAAQHKDAEAFYEYQWETMRTGPDRGQGASARDKAGRIATGRSMDITEILRVAEAVKGMQTDPAASLATIRKVEDSRGDRFILDLLAAEALAAGGRTADAIAQYRALIKKDVYFVPAYVELAEQLVKAGKSDEADKMREKATSIDPDNWRLKSKS